jgi:hypothetical protein
MGINKEMWDGIIDKIKLEKKNTKDLDRKLFLTEMLLELLQFKEAFINFESQKEILPEMFNERCFIKFDSAGNQIKKNFKDSKTEACILCSHNQMLKNMFKKESNNEKTIKKLS